MPCHSFHRLIVWLIDWFIGWYWICYASVDRLIDWLVAFVIVFVYHVHFRKKDDLAFFFVLSQYAHLSISVSLVAFYEKAEVKGDPSKPNHLIVAISSDRGLCGGIHSGIVKAIKLDLAEKKNLENVKLVAVGDKARGILQRYVHETHIFDRSIDWLIDCLVFCWFLNASVCCSIDLLIDWFVFLLMLHNVRQLIGWLIWLADRFIIRLIDWLIDWTRSSFLSFFIIFYFRKKLMSSSYPTDLSFSGNFGIIFCWARRSWAANRRHSGMPRR